MRPWNSCLELMEISLKILLLTLPALSQISWASCSLRLHRSSAATARRVEGLLQSGRHLHLHQRRDSVSGLSLLAFGQAGNGCTRE